jgi:hypothetical protein
MDHNNILHEARIKYDRSIYLETPNGYSVDMGYYMSFLKKDTLQ